MVFILHP